MLKLVKLEEKYIPLLFEMMDEWTATGEKIIPWAIRKCDYRDIQKYMDSLEVKEPMDGIRPSERGKGLGTKMIALALEECDKLGIREVLMCCDKDNPASARTIVKNGGVLENEVLDEGDLVQRYWIRR